MIDNLSTGAALYLAPILSLTSFFLSLFAYLSPTVMLHKQVALLVISPSSALVSPNHISQSNVDGPTLRLGILGSCGQHGNSSPLNCTVTSFAPDYDISILPSSSNPDVLTGLPSSASVAILIALIFSTLFFILFAVISSSNRLGKLGVILSKPLYTRASAWLGLAGFLIGMTAYLVLRMWFGKMADDFNKGIIKQGTHGPQLIANIGNIFTMIWVAHAFAVVPLVCAMTKLHVSAVGASGKA